MVQPSDPAFSFLTLGVGNAFSARNYTFCLALFAEGRWLLVDCPHPIRKIMSEGAGKAGLGLDIADLSGVALTHLHADHASGLEDLAFWSVFVLGKRVPLLAHPDVSERLWEHHLKGSMEPTRPCPDADSGKTRAEDYLDLIDLSLERSVEYGPFSVECRFTLHPIPCTAFRIKAGGRTLGISADTAYDPGLIAWLAEADLVIHEVGPPLHTPYEKLMQQPAWIRDKMRLIHYPDSFDVEASEIEVLREGRFHRV